MKLLIIGGALLLAVLLVGGAAWKKRASGIRRAGGQADGGGASPAGDPLVRIYRVPVWIGPGPIPAGWGMHPAWRNALWREMRLSELRPHYGAVRVDEAGRVLVTTNARRGGGEVSPIIRREIRSGAGGVVMFEDRFDVATASTPGHVGAIQVAVVVGSAVATAVGGPAAGAAVGAGGAALIAASS